jgi:hypothetical protein
VVRIYTACFDGKEYALPVVTDWIYTKLRVCENMMLRRIFGLKRNEVTGGWRRLYNEELHNLYSSPSIIRVIKSKRVRWGGHVARMREKRNAYRILVGKTERKRPLERPRRNLVEKY